MKTLTILSLLLFTTSISTFAQKTDFEKYLIKHRDWKETADTKWELNLDSENGSLRYIGAAHLDQPGHPQFKYIKDQWNVFKPTIAFYEGPDRGIGENDTLTIRKFGESGYVRYLAKQLAIPTKSLEPAIIDLYNYLLSKYSQNQVDVYMLTKEAMRLRTRKNLTKEELTNELGKMIAMVPKMLGKEISIKSIDQLEVAFGQLFGKEIAWWQAPGTWYDPQEESNRVTNKLAMLSTEYRDVYMVKVLSESIAKGEKVFAVVGRNHIPLQANALKYATGMK